MYCKNNNNILWCFPRNFSLINPFYAISSLSSFSVSPSALSSLKLHRLSKISHPSPKFLTRFTLTHLHRWSFTLTHSSIRPHPFTLTDSPLPIHPHPHTFSRVFGFWVKILQKRSSVDVGGFSSVGVSANCKVGFDQCIRFFLFVFDSACVCVWVLINVLKKKPTKFCLNFFIF